MCCVWQLDFFLKKNCSKNGGNGPKIGFIGKFSHFFWIWSIKKANICCILALKSASWDMGQNALGQSYWRIFKLTVSPEHKTWFFARYRLMEIKSWLKNMGLGVVKNRCGYSGLRTLKLAVSLKGINGINWFLVCW